MVRQQQAWVVVVLALVHAHSLAQGPSPSRTIQSSGTTSRLNSMHFVNGNEGRAAAEEGSALFHTVDGGASWRRVETGTQSPAWIRSVRFLDPNLGWAGSGYAVMRTRDGGATWQRLLLPDTLIVDPLFPVSETVAWTVARANLCNPCGYGHARYTFGPESIESKVTFQGFSFPLREDPQSQSALYFVDADNGWSVGTSGRIFRIRKGSSAAPEFSSQSSGTRATLNAIQMVDLGRGWIVGDAGTILRTADGGTTWSTQFSGVTTSLQAVHFNAEGSEGWVVGDRGVVLRTLDGGANWRAEASGVSTDLRAVHFASANAGYAAGANGTILRYLSPSDYVFSYAERAYAGLFSPVGAVSQTSAPYYYRYYPGTNAYLGTSSLYNKLYYLGPATGNTLYDAGPLSNWRATASRQ